MPDGRRSARRRPGSADRSVHGPFTPRTAQRQPPSLACEWMRRLLTLLATAFVVLLFPISAAFADGTDPITQAHDELASIDAQIQAVRQQLDDSRAYLIR